MYPVHPGNPGHRSQPCHSGHPGKHGRAGHQNSLTGPSGEEQLGEPRYATRQQHSEVTSSKVELSKTTISTLKAIKIKLVCA